MKLTTISGLAAAVALFLPLGATAQSLSELEELSHEDRRAWFEAMSPDERAAKRAELIAERDAMSDEDRQAMRDRRRASHDQRRAEWDSLSDEERAAKREQMRGRRDEMRQRFESMSPEEREAFKQQRRERDHGNRDRHRGDHAGQSRSEKDSV